MIRPLLLIALVALALSACTPRDIPHAGATPTPVHSLQPNDGSGGPPQH